jgi:thioredoxin reductase (NADPH)
MEKYDLIIVGGGPGGLTAAIYAGRYKLKTLIITREAGGTASTAHKICNYPGFLEIGGFDLMHKIFEQVENLEIPVEYATVENISKVGEDFKVVTDSGGEFMGSKVIYSLGSERKHLGAKNEDLLAGKGISYCATCDGPFQKDKVVAVIGGGDAALTAALLLAEYATKVYVIYRQEAFLRGEPSWVEMVEKNEKIESIFSEEVTDFVGTEKLTAVRLKNAGKDLPVDGVFVEVGIEPNVKAIDLLKIELDGKYIKVDKSQKTNVAGFYAIGDVTNNVLKQIVTASGGGATAAYGVYHEISKQRHEV